MTFYQRITTNNCEAYFLESLSNKILFVVRVTLLEELLVLHG